MHQAPILWLISVPHMNKINTFLCEIHVAQQTHIVKCMNNIVILLMAWGQMLFYMHQCQQHMVLVLDYCTEYEQK